MRIIRVGFFSLVLLGLLGVFLGSGAAQIEAAPAQLMDNSVCTSWTCGSISRWLYSLDVYVAAPSSAARLPALQTNRGITSMLLMDEFVAQVSETTVYSYTAGLSGERPVLIGGTPVTLATRYTLNSVAVAQAMQYAYEHFEALGLETSYHDYSSLGASHSNVIAEQPGKVDPLRIYLITAHLDSTSNEPETLAPGADDNASGSVGVLVAADILSQYEFAYTVRYVLFSGEEQGLHGSEAYAEYVAGLGEEIAGVLNLDMIAYNSTEKPEPVVELHTRPGVDGAPDLYIAELFSNTIATYDLDLDPEILPSGISASDHASFWLQDYPAILVIEDFEDFNPYYHNTEDTLDKVDMGYFTDLVKASVGTISHLAGFADFDYFSREPESLRPILFSAGNTFGTSQVTYSWDFGDGGPEDGRFVTHTYPFVDEERDYTVTLSAAALGNTLSMQRVLTVQGAAVEITYTPVTSAGGQTFVFAGGVTPDAAALTYTWDFGDGTSLVHGNPVTHTYAASGGGQGYPLTLTVDHASGQVVRHETLVFDREYLFLPMLSNARVTSD